MTTYTLTVEGPGTVKGDSVVSAGALFFTFYDVIIRLNKLFVLTKAFIFTFNKVSIRASRMIQVAQLDTTTTFWPINLTLTWHLRASPLSTFQSPHPTNLTPT